MREIGRTKAQVLRAILDYDIASMKCEDVKSQDIVAFAREISTNRSPATVANYMSHLGAAELAQPGLELYGAARTRPCVKIDIPLARAHARAVASGYADQGYFSARDMLHGLLASTLMDTMAAYKDHDLSVATDWRPEWLRQRLDLQRYDGDDWPF